MKNQFAFLLSVVLIAGCSASKQSTNSRILANRKGEALKSTVVLKEAIKPRVINTKNVSPDALMAFAETLQGIPYKYGSASKEKGFDCSGFINYVFNHHKISVPRVSKDFTNAGKEVSTLESARGDIILFTGSDANSGVVGHMGLITRNDNGVIQFIHASSGSGGGVMVSKLNSYFIPRFVKVIRIFPNL